MLLEEAADRPAAAQGEEQQVAGDDRRQDERQVDEAVHQRLARKTRGGPAGGNDPYGLHRPSLTLFKSSAAEHVAVPSLPTTTPAAKLASSAASR